tara:strand:+ start:364 stop:675 length:312 start_codon:yes stop_codon:yes gene_type:complete
MINIKKILLNFFLISALAGCAQNTALLGPLYTYGSTGSSLQAGLSYGSNEAITRFTGKSATKNIEEILQPNKRDRALRKLLKKRIIETRKKLNLVKVKSPKLR